MRDRVIRAWIDAESYRLSTYQTVTSFGGRIHRRRVEH